MSSSQELKHSVEPRYLVIPTLLIELSTLAVLESEHYIARSRKGQMDPTSAFIQLSVAWLAVA